VNRGFEKGGLWGRSWEKKASQRKAEQNEQERNFLKRREEGLIKGGESEKRWREGG